MAHLNLLPQKKQSRFPNRLGSGQASSLGYFLPDGITCSTWELADGYLGSLPNLWTKIHLQKNTTYRWDMLVRATQKTETKVWPFSDPSLDGGFNPIEKY